MEVAELNVAVAVVSFTGAGLLDAYEQEIGLPGFCYFADPDRALYTGFGFGRGSIARVWLSPKVWARYAALIARGRRPKAPGEDTLQLGGDVVVDAGGVIRWVYASEGPDDRPSLTELRRALSLAATPSA